MENEGLRFSSREEHRRWLKSVSALPAGFRVGTTRFSFVPQELERQCAMALTVIALDEPTPAFCGLFTRNAVCGAPVSICRERLKGKGVGAVLVNTKVANVGAPGGIEAAQVLCAKLGELLGIGGEEVLPASTGVIGWSLPVEEMVSHLPQAVSALQTESVLPAAEGIMTTDLYPKVRRAQVGKGSIVGIAKGAGMIEPNLATMLVYILTDVDVAREELEALLETAASESFNAISIDSDQSTSDMLIALASRKKPWPGRGVFYEGLFEVCRKLALDIVRNGEGVRHVVQVRTLGAPSRELAKETGKAVINSPLAQCAIGGNDPNVGRLAMAVGDYIGNNHPALDLRALEIRLCGYTVYSQGSFMLGRVLEKELVSCLKRAELYQSAPPENGVFRPPIDWPPHENMVEIEVDLGCGGEEFTVWGCDRTHEYISENADYRS